MALVIKDVFGKPIGGTGAITPTGVGGTTVISPVSGEKFAKPGFDTPPAPVAIPEFTPPPIAQAPEPVQAPSALDSFAKFLEAFGEPQFLTPPTPTAPEFQKAGFLQTSGLPPEFFQLQRDKLKEDLREQFFGSLGVAQQTAAGEASSGRLGSGVSKRIIEEAVTSPFLKTSAQIDKDSLELQLAEQARAQEFNAVQFNQYSQTLATLRDLDSKNITAAEKANADIQQNLNTLALQAADADANRMSKAQLAQLDIDFKTWQTALLDARAEAQLTIDKFRADTDLFRAETEFASAEFNQPQPTQDATPEAPNSFPDFPTGSNVGAKKIDTDNNEFTWNGKDWVFTGKIKATKSNNVFFS
jgi:hypothetical protein